MHKYHIQVNVQFLYNIYINYKTQKQNNYRNAKTIEPIPSVVPQRLVIDSPFDKSLFNQFGVKLFERKSINRK